MGTALGSVGIEMYADTIRLQSDLGRAAAMVDARMAQIGRAADVAKKAFIALGAALAIERLASKFDGVVAAAAGLQDLAEKTGAAVEGLSALAGVAALSGTSTDELGAALVKLNRSVVDAQNGGEKTTAAFEAIGISVKDLKGLAPDEVFKLIGAQLANYADGGEKAVVATELLGKAGANLLPVLNDLNTAADYQVRLTGEQAQAADELEKNQVRLRASTDAIFKAIAIELVPALNIFAVTMIQAQNNTDGLRGSVKQLADDGSLKTWGEVGVSVIARLVDAVQMLSRLLEATGRLTGGVAASISAAVSGDFAKAGQIAGMMKSDIDAIDKRPLFSAQLAKNFAANQAAPVPKPPAPKPTINTSKLGSNNPAIARAPAVPRDDPSKKLLEGTLKARESDIAAEKTQLQSRLEAVDFYRSLDYLTLRESETRKQNLLLDSLTQTQSQYDAQISALKSAIAEKDKLIADEKGAAPQYTKGPGGKKVLRERTQEEQNTADKVRTQRQDLVNRLDEVTTRRGTNEIETNKQIEESSRRLLAVQREFDLETQSRTALAAGANSNLLAEIDHLGKDTLEVEKLTNARRIQADLELRIAAIKRKDPNVDVSGAQAQAAQQIADSGALITLAYNKQRDAGFGASEAIRKYQEDATNAGAQIQTALSSAFHGAEDALVSFFTKSNGSIQSLVQGFKSMADSIVADITRMIVKQNIMAPLAAMLGLTMPGAGGGGAGAGGGDLFGQLIGTGISFLTGTANPGIGPPIPGRAAGGPVSAGGLYQVNELNRPELLEVSGKQYLMMGDRAGKVIPNNLKAGGREYLSMGRDEQSASAQSVNNSATSIFNVNVTPPAGSSRETAQQWGAMAGRQIQLAQRRNS